MTVKPLIIATFTALIAVGSQVPVATEAKHRRTPCYPPDTKTVARDSTGRVFDDEIDVYGCLYHHGEHVSLSDLSDASFGGDVESRYNDNNRAPIAIAGRYVAFVTDGCNIQGCETFLNVSDLRQRVGRYFARTGQTDCDSETCWEGQVTDIALKRNGSVAWIVCERTHHTETLCQNRHFEVWRIDTRSPSTSGFFEPTLLDSGATIDRRSLRLSPSRKGVYWVKDGKQYSASLR